MSMPVEEFAALRLRPAVLFPHGSMANSPTQPVCDLTRGKFGPFSGQFIVGEMNTPRLIRVMLDEVNGVVQGSCVPFVNGAGMRAGNHRLAFAPDGSLWVGQTHLAWAGGEGLQRITWKGALPMEVLALQLRPGGFLFTLTRPLDATAIPPAGEWKIRRYSYMYHSTYGSPQVGLTRISPETIELREGGRQLWCAIPDIRGEGTVYEFTLPPLRAADGTKLLNTLVCYTVNSVPR
jgi:hypothetical protein